MRVLIIFIVTSVLIFADDWPQFRGVDRNGISGETGISKDWKANPPKELWRTSVSDDGFAGPSAAGGMVYVIDREGSGDALRAIDMSGKEVWKYSYPEKASFNYGFSRSTPAYNNGKVYGLSMYGHFYCVDAKTGAEVWAMNIVKKFGGVLPKWQYALSPFIDGDNVIIVPGGGKNPIAVNKESGEMVWQGDVEEGVSYATPVVATIGGIKQYILFLAKSLTGVDANGRKLWSVPWETSYDVNAALPLVIDDRIFITSGYKHGCALVKVDGKSASIVWENKNVQAHFSSPVLYNGAIYASSDPDDVVCLDIDTGNVKWRKGVIEKGGFIIIDGVIIAHHGKTGEVIMIEANPAAYTELGRFQPFKDGKPAGTKNWHFWTAPIVVDKKLIVRSPLEMACFDLQ
ncbi:MAG: PQQ-binding-like beta-propeller repeat protein [Spirochaetota bacterium]